MLMILCAVKLREELFQAKGPPEEGRSRHFWCKIHTFEKTHGCLTPKIFQQRALSREMRVKSTQKRDRMPVEESGESRRRLRVLVILALAPHAFRGECALRVPLHAS
jgi:hypothetical protein